MSECPDLFRQHWDVHGASHCVFHASIPLRGLKKEGMQRLRVIRFLILICTLKGELLHARS